MHRHPHVLNAASNLLGISFVIIGGIRYAKANGQSFADETAWLAAVCFLISIFASYWAIRMNDTGRLQNLTADIAFFSGLLLLFLSMLMVVLLI